MKQNQSKAIPRRTAIASIATGTVAAVAGCTATGDSDPVQRKYQLDVHGFDSVSVTWIGNDLQSMTVRLDPNADPGIKTLFFAVHDSPGIFGSKTRTFKRTLSGTTSVYTEFTDKQAVRVWGTPYTIQDVKGGSTPEPKQTWQFALLLSEGELNLYTDDEVEKRWS